VSEPAAIPTPEPAERVTAIAATALDAPSGRSGPLAPRPSARETAALTSVADTTELPLRLSAFYFEPNERGEVATLLAIEVVPPPAPGSERVFKVVSEARARDGGPPVRDHFELAPAQDAAGPAVLARQWHLPAGVWQLRLLVEDGASGRIGTAIHTFEVPGPAAFRLSTPILTTEIEDPGGRRKPKLGLARTFRAGSLLYCQYSVYGAPGGGAPARVLGSWTLRRGDTVVREAPPTPIQPAADGRVTRTLGVSLQGAETGEYALVLTARDEKTGASLTRTEPFTVAP
jgi:hypothetical protein